NINTVWDVETLAAVCDPQPANSFSNPTLLPILFDAISKSRMPSGTFSANDRPYRGMATPYSAGDSIGDSQYPAGLGVDDPLLRTSTSGLLNVPRGDSRSNLQDVLLNKIYNRLTTRSNVFAIWLTVGFFEVVRDTDAQGNPLRPVRLGAEIGRAENRNIRHRMFAIVDRTNLSTLANVTRSRNDILAGSQSKPQTMQLENVAGLTSSPPFPVSWNIKPGSALIMEDPANPEVVLATTVDVAAK